MRLPPRSEALAYRIWAYANPLGWDCTVPEIAEAVGVKPQSVSMLLFNKGWKSRTRTMRTDRNSGLHADFGLSLDSTWSATVEVISELHLEGASE